MAIRRMLRGTVPETELESVAREAVERRGESFDSVRVLEAENWLSTPAVVNERFFLKIISTQNMVIQGLLTTSRNIGIFSSGNEAFFERFTTPLEMAEHEFDATREIREIGVNAPEPVEVFEYGGYGVLVLEYLPAFETLDSVDPDTAEELAPVLFESLTRMHEAGLAHGDLRGENVLVTDGELYFIDATNVKEGAIKDARAYDIACGLAALEPLIGAPAAVEAAAQHCSSELLLAAEQYLDFVNLRPDHAFRVFALEGEIEKAVRIKSD